MLRIALLANMAAEHSMSSDSIRSARLKLLSATAKGSQIRCCSHQSQKICRRVDTCFESWSIVTLSQLMLCTQVALKNGRPEPSHMPKWITGRHATPYGTGTVFLYSRFSVLAESSRFNFLPKLWRTRIGYNSSLPRQAID